LREQGQQGGDESTNVQAGRDLILHVGLTVEEVRTIALDLFRANFLELRGVAQEVAAARAEKITLDYIAELQKRLPRAIESSADPDMQRAIFNAQREYACSGDEDLEQVLVDLLVDRAGQTERGIETMVLNEAIVAAPKLSADQRAAIAASFIVRYSRYVGPPSLDVYYELHVRRNMGALSEGVPVKSSAYQHIEYVGAGSVGIGELTLEQAMSAAAGFFTKGVPREQIPEQLRPYADDARVFMPSLRDSSHLQLTAMYEDDVDPLALLIGEPGVAGIMRNLLQNRMTGPEINAEVIERVPEMEALFAAWNGSSLKNLRLTTVGIAIGHGYWRRVTGVTAPLSGWLF
jgi:hypothetical protein